MSRKKALDARSSEVPRRAPAGPPRTVLIRMQVGDSPVRWRVAGRDGAPGRKSGVCVLAVDGVPAQIRPESVADLMQAGRHSLKQLEGIGYRIDWRKVRAVAGAPATARRVTAPLGTLGPSSTETAQRLDEA